MPQVTHLIWAPEICTPETAQCNKFNLARNYGVSFVTEKDLYRYVNGRIKHYHERLRELTATSTSAIEAADLRAKLIQQLTLDKGPPTIPTSTSATTTSTSASTSSSTLNDASIPAAIGTTLPHQ